VNSAKARLAGLALLDRALNSITDEELDALLGALPDDHRTAVRRMSGIADEDDVTSEEITSAIRSTASRGRMNGDLDRIAGVLTDPCLADCIEQLGPNADLPTEDDLLGVTPGLAERHGVATVRLMLAAAVAGEAPASPTITRLLKHDEVLALPAVQQTAAVRPAVPAPTPEESAERDAVKAKRKEERKRKQAEQAARRAQAEQARRKH
jgi:hypothetical protein